VLSLFLDGARKEVEQLEVQSLDGTGGDQIPGANNSVLNGLAGFLGQPDLGALNADIAFNTPYAGPFGQVAVLAGEMAVHNAVFGQQ
jgi:hypothetical protein